MSRPDERFELAVDGTTHRLEADPEIPLLWALRDLLGITAPKYGCGVGLCGACTVLEDGVPLRSCQIPLGSAAGRSFTTLAGLTTDGSHPVQRAWLEEDVAQCGFCQSGLILETVALLARNPSPSDREIDAALADLLCRCGTYDRARRAVRRAAELLAQGRP